MHLVPGVFKIFQQRVYGVLSLKMAYQGRPELYVVLPRSFAVVTINFWLSNKAKIRGTASYGLKPIWCKITKLLNFFYN